MRLCRIARLAHAALDGEGARLYGGRWNAEAIAVVYTSATLSLAALESVVHVDLDEAPRDLVSLAIDIPGGGSIHEVDADLLPPGWRDPEGDPACVDAGSRWARAGSTLLLRVPSAVIPHEYDFLLDPRHPAAKSLAVTARQFAFDPRLFR